MKGVDTMAVMITTKDNPFNPFTQFDEWFAFDEQNGYRTSSYLARISRTAPDLSSKDNELAIEDAINEIMYFDGGNLYEVVRYDDPGGGT